MYIFYRQLQYSMTGGTKQIGLDSGHKPGPSAAPRHQNSRRDRKPARRNAVQCKEGGMYVPSDSFSGMSPERKAAQAMISFFTFTAVRIVLAQLEGSGRGGLGSFNTKAYQDLTDLLEELPLKDGDAWIEALMRRNEMLGVRVMEVRAAYAREDFEWDNMQSLSVIELEARNTKLMRKHADVAFRQAFQSGKGDSPEQASS